MAAETPLAAAPEVFPHIRIVIGMVIGLGVTRLLTGIARIIQHPGQTRLYAVHLAWVASLLLYLVHFWWWEFGLFRIEDWTFGAYLFVIGYAVLLFLLCALLFPDQMADYSGYEDFFLDRRAWFFGLLAATYLMDVVDTLIKGEDHFARFGAEYLVRTPLLAMLCMFAIRTRDRRFHIALVAFTLIYQISWIARLFGKIA